MTYTGRFEVRTRGNTDVIDINGQVEAEVKRAGVTSGMAVVFVVGSTAGITTTESEPGLLNHDLKAFFERVAPEHERYRHQETWHDDNGHSHVRASALGPSISLPVIDGRLPLGTWQQIILIDFDTRPRERQVIVQVIGE